MMIVLNRLPGCAKLLLFTVLFLYLFVAALTPTKNATAQNTPAQAPISTSADGSEDFVLNFRNIDIRLFIESLSELTGKSFLIDPRVGGKVTVIGDAVVPRDQIYDVMLSIFTMYGLRAVESEHGITRIVPAKIASRNPPPAGITSDLITEIVPVVHLDAPTIVPLIKPFMTPEAQVIVHKPTNQLIITEVRTHLHYIKEIMQRIDVDDVGQFEIINLKNMAAKEMVSLVQRAGNKYLKGLVQIVADNKNERIIMTGPVNARLPLRTLIVEIDSSQNVVDPVSSIRVIPLEYAKVADVEKIIKGVLSATSFLSIYGGEGAYLGEGEKEPATAAQAQEGQADDAATQQQQDERAVEERVQQNKRNFTIQSDRATNSLIVGGPAHILTLVTSLVKSLDVARPQVLIEAIITELSSVQTEALGTQIGMQTQESGGVRVPVFDRNSFKSLIGAFAGNSFVFGYQGAINRHRREDGMIYYNPVHILVQALETDNNTRILATPSVVTLNNEEAVINIAEERSILLGNVDANNINRQNYQRTEFGTKLTVTPQVTAGNNVRLDINQITSDVVAGQGASDRPVSNKREIKTNVVVSDGSILVLGGLTQNRQREILNRVPLLSEIPVLGFFFRNRNDNSNNTNLMVFIKPTIIKAPPNADAITKEQYAKLRLQQIRQLRREAKQGKKIDQDYVLLPPLKEIGIQLKPERRQPSSDADNRLRIRKPPTTNN